MERMTRRYANRRGALAAALLLLTVLTPFPAAASFICTQCMSANDTASSPGIVGSASWLVTQAAAPPVVFVGADRKLRCALPAPPSWGIEVVDSAAGAGGCSMVLDDLGRPNIGFHDASRRLFHAHQAGTGWVRDPINESSVVSGGTSIARVNSGFAIAFVDSVTGLLEFAEQNAVGIWNTEVVTAVGTAEAYPSLVVDEPVRAISYYDATAGELRLALRQVPGAWSTQTIDGGNVGGYTSLVGGPSHGGFGVAYYDFGNADLRYARSTIGGGWLIETVDGVGDSVGQFCSAVALAGTPEEPVGIAYYDRTHGDLKYALRQGGAWTLTTLDSIGDAGAWASCGGTPAPNDTVGIAYVERTHGDLKYLFRTSGVTAVPAQAPEAGPLRVEWSPSADGTGGTIRFTVPVGGKVRVRVYDPLGRLMAVPLRKDLPAGTAEARWDGRDERGRTVRSGVFLVQVETPGGAGTARAVLLH